jgi:hypothetical protein
VHVDNRTLTQRQAAGDPIRVEGRTPHVVDRDELLADIHQRFTAAPADGPVVTVALIGLGGVGKTTAAVEYTYRHLGDYRIVWHLHAETTTGLLSEFHDLAVVLDADTGGDPVAAVHAALAAEVRPWLLVFDNLRDHATARPFLPAKGSGRVLVTSQDGTWPARQAIELTGFSLAAAAEFLLDNTTAMPDLATAQAVAMELGLLPLAVAQAAAYLHTTGLTLTDYRQLLRDQPTEMWQRGAPAGHATPVAATWNLAFADLAAHRPTSVALLRLLACMAPEDIPIRLLLSQPADPARNLPAAVAGVVAALTANALAFRDAVEGLRRHSLIGPPTDVTTVHRLVQRITLDQLEPDQRAHWRTAAARLIEAVIPADVTVKDAWPICAQLLPHALATCDPLGAPLRRLARYLGEAGDYTTARTVWTTLTDAHTTALGGHHPDTLAARADLAYWTGEAGDAVAARDLYRELLPLRIRVSGAEHPDTLTVRADLARWTGEAGDAVAARDLYWELLPLRIRVSGAEHPDTLSTRADLAGWTGRAGDAAAARDLYWKLLPLRIKVSGAEHPDTLTDRTHLANWTGRAGDAAAARHLYRELLPLHVKVSGAEHPDTLTVRADLAHWTGQAGDAAAARDLYWKLLPLRIKVSGAEHPDTLSSRADLASWTGQAGDAAAARHLYRELLPLHVKVSGAEHPDTLSSRANLAHWTGRAGDAAAARDLYRELLPLQVKVSGAEHPDTLNYRSSLAYWTRRARWRIRTAIGTAKRADRRD